MLKFTLLVVPMKLFIESEPDVYKPMLCCLWLLVH